VNYDLADLTTDDRHAVEIRMLDDKTQRDKLPQELVPYGGLADSTNFLTV
jgi:hypothetical protein